MGTLHPLNPSITPSWSRDSAFSLLSLSVSVRWCLTPHFYLWFIYTFNPLPSLCFFVFKIKSTNFSVFSSAASLDWEKSRGGGVCRNRAKGKRKSGRVRQAGMCLCYHCHYAALTVIAFVLILPITFTVINIDLITGVSKSLLILFSESSTQANT